MIKVNEKYAIDSDKDQWVIKHFNPSKRDPDYWRPIKFYTTLDSAIKSLGDMMIRESDYDSAQQLMSNVRNTVKLLNDTFEGVSVTTIEVDAHAR